MISFQFRSEEHYIPNFLELTQWLRKEFKRYHNSKGLFVYQARKSGNWVVAEWRDKPGGEIEDLVIVGEDPRMFNRALRDKVEWLLVGPAADPCKMIESYQNDHDREQQDFHDEDLDANRWLARRCWPEHPLAK